MSDENWADSAFYGSADIGINSIDHENANSTAARTQADSDGESDDKSVAHENDSIGGGGGGGGGQDEQNENMTDEEHSGVCVNDDIGAGARAGAVKIPFTGVKAELEAPVAQQQTTRGPERSSATFLASHLGLAGFGDTDSPLVQAVRELTENALDSHATRVRVRVTLGSPQCSRGGCSNYLIEVEDNGCGLPGDTLETLLGSVFSSTKAGGMAGEGGRGGGRGFGRYGIGVKAALLYASSSLELLGIPNATPLFIATATTEATSLTSAYLGIGGVPLSAKVIDRKELSKEGGDDDNNKDLHGTFLRLSLSADAYTARARIAGEELQAYFARFSLLPRAGGADIEFLLDTAASLALCFNDGNSALAAPSPLRSLSHIANEALINGREAMAVANQSLGTGAGAAGAEQRVGDVENSDIIINAAGIEHVPGWQTEGREHLARALRVPLACVAVAAAKAATAGPMVEVRVWIVMTPDGGGGGGGGSGGSGGENAPPASRESALIHILRFSCGVPLIKGASACALTRGASDNQIWSGIGLTLERAARGPPSRRTIAALSGAPAAPLARRSSVAVDAPGAFIASSSVIGFPLVPFAEARVFIDARGTPGAPPLAFTDLSKTSLRLGRGARCPAALTRVALKTAFVTLRAQLPANLLEPASARHVRLLRDVYLPDIAAQLVAALSDAGEGSNTWHQARQIVESVAGALPLGSFQVQLEAVRRFLAARLDAQADLVLSVAEEVGGGSVRDNTAPTVRDDGEDVEGGVGTDNRGSSSEWVAVAAASVEHLEQPIDENNESSGSDDFSAALSRGREFARTTRQAAARRLRRRLREET